MPFTQLYYHIVWATRRREPLVTSELESAVVDLIRTKAVRLGARVWALNAMPDHVHLVASVPARIAVATFVGQVKGVTSAHYNREHSLGPALYWQEEYGAFTFDRKALAGHVAYVEGQKDHHRQGTTIAALERLSDDARA